jgi:hypothetical protein
VSDFLRTFLDLLNETLTSAIVVVAASMLLYNLTRNLKNRVARTSGAVLTCVTIVYVADVLISLGPGLGTFEALLRLKWVGLAFLPAAIFHLSDALLATTGLPSRGRRRRIVRILYGFAALFMLLAAFTDLLVLAVIINGRVSLQIAPLFPVYVLYFALITTIAFNNVQRARRRCRTRSTERRMGYLQIAMLFPVIGIFPYSVLLAPGDEFTLRALLLVNLANLLMIFMLLFLSYPLSFFGSQIPDRVVKAELLRFMLRGPATGLLALVVIIFTVPATQFLGIPGEAFMPFAVVAVILLWQWGVDLALPWLERILIYDEDDGEQLTKLQNLSERLLTRADLLQLIEANLEAACDYLRVSAAFVATLTNHQPGLVKTIGAVDVTAEELQAQLPDLIARLEIGEQDTAYIWRAYRLFPLFSGRTSEEERPLIGMLGVEALAGIRELAPDDEQMLRTIVLRLARTLDDMLLQTEIYAALEGLLPQFTVTRRRAAEVEYRPGRSPMLPADSAAYDRDQLVEQVHAALRHYYGGPGMSSSRLLELAAVRHALEENDNNPTRALRAVLLRAIENQRPGEGERDLKSPEWMLYNILYLRFIEQRKVRETARRLYISEANLYRKQNVAIEAVADALIDLEEEALANHGQSAPGRPLDNTSV